MLKTLSDVCFWLALVMVLAYFYQFIYTVVGLVCRKKQKTHTADAEPHRFAALICARDEEGVIGELVESLKKQRYPRDMLDIYVLADNCTDATAVAAAGAGAFVYERFNKEKIGKGYALDYLLGKIKDDRGENAYDGFFVFDADNIVHRDFVREMNKTFSAGYNVITCYRNSKNFAKNWITYSYSLWFMHEARFINYPRMLLGNGCAVSGTGFLVGNEVVLKNGGWPFHLLTEDIQFSVDCALTGCKIGYCDKAMVYDEQPETFSQSWTQRMRWSKGFYQVDARYLKSLAKAVITEKGMRMTCYDILMTVAPGMLFSAVLSALSLTILILCIDAPALMATLIISRTLQGAIISCVWAYFGMLGIGLLTVISEWKRIDTSTFNKLKYLLLFPLFMATYIPISLVAAFKKVEWKPIKHYSCAR